MGIDGNKVNNSFRIEWVKVPDKNKNVEKYNQKSEDIGLNGGKNLGNTGDSVSFGTQKPETEAEAIVYNAKGEVVGHIKGSRIGDIGKLSSVTKSDGNIIANQTEEKGNTFTQQITVETSDGSFAKVKENITKDGSANTSVLAEGTDYPEEMKILEQLGKAYREQVQSEAQKPEKSSGRERPMDNYNAKSNNTKYINDYQLSKKSELKDLYDARHISTEQAAKAVERQLKNPDSNKNPYEKAISGMSDEQLNNTCAELAKGNWDEEKTKLAKAIIESKDSRLTFSLVQGANTTEIQKNLLQIQRGVMADIDGANSTKNKLPYGTGTNSNNVKAQQNILAKNPTSSEGSITYMSNDPRAQKPVAETMKLSGYEPTGDAQLIKNENGVKVYKQQFKSSTGDIKTAETTIDSKTGKTTKTITNGNLTKAQKTETDKNVYELQQSSVSKNGKIENKPAEQKTESASSDAKKTEYKEKSVDDYIKDFKKQVEQDNQIIQDKADIDPESFVRILNTDKNKDTISAEENNEIQENYECRKVKTFISGNNGKLAESDKNYANGQIHYQDIENTNIIDTETAKQRLNELLKKNGINDEKTVQKLTDNADEDKNGQLTNSELDGLIKEINSYADKKNKEKEGAKQTSQPKPAERPQEPFRRHGGGLRPQM